MSCRAAATDQRLIASIKRPGKRTEIAFGAIDLPYVDREMADMLLRELGNEVQLVQVGVAGSDDPVWIVNALHEEPCLDESNSRFTKWEGDSIAARRMAGKYRMVVKLIVDKNKTGGHDILRPWGWHPALIISERLKLLIEGVGATSSRFILV